MGVVGVLDEMRSGEQCTEMVRLQGGALTRLSWDAPLVTALDDPRTAAAASQCPALPAQRVWQL
ncbi:MAG: hypothetical protein AB1505_31120 [Candidatus Latescibacterota bacterium]